MNTFVHYHQISPRLFREHLDYYKKRYVLTSLETLAYDKPLPTKPLFITFDDGWGTTYDLLPIYREIPGLITIFISLSFLRSKQYLPLTLGQIKEMSEAVNFQSHGVSHSDITKLSSEKVKTELRESKAIIESITGKTVYAFAYPYNRHTDREPELIKQCGYRLARVGGRMLNRDDADRYNLASIGIPKTCTVNELRYRLTKARIKTFLRGIHVY